MSRVIVTVCLPSASGLSVLQSTLSTLSDFLGWASAVGQTQSRIAASVSAKTPRTHRVLVRAILVPPKPRASLRTQPLLADIVHREDWRNHAKFAIRRAGSR